MQTYWTFHDDMAVIHGVILKGRHVIILGSFKKGIRRTPLKPHGNRKVKLLEHESIYCISINDVIEKHIKIAQHVIIFGKHNQMKI